MNYLVDELEYITKEANRKRKSRFPLMEPTFEIAGLGTLAAPYLIGKRAKLMHITEKFPELAGLSILAIPSAVKVYKHVRGNRN
jgi:hypothetical protein